MNQKNRGTPLDCHYSEYSIHYNMCSQLATRIMESSSVNTAGFSQLRQQFNAQFNQQPHVSTDSSHSLPSSFFSYSFDEIRKKQMEELRRASEPLQLNSVVFTEKSEDDDMQSIESSSSSDFDTICDSESSSIEFESIQSSESGMIFLFMYSLDLPEELNDDIKSTLPSLSTLSDIYCEYVIKSDRISDLK